MAQVKVAVVLPDSALVNDCPTTEPKMAPIELLAPVAAAATATPLTLLAQTCPKMPMVMPTAAPAKEPLPANRC